MFAPMETVWMISGPIIFASFAFWLYRRYEKKNAETSIESFTKSI